MKKNLSGLLFSAAIATTTLASLSAPFNASAAALSSTFTYSFDNIFPIKPSSSEGSGDLLNGFLKMDVTNSQGGVTFIFKNLASNPEKDSYIGDIFIDTLKSYTAILGSSAPTKVSSLSSGVTSFTGQDKGNLPQGEKVSFSDDYQFKRDGGGAENGIQKGESFAAKFSDGKFNEVIEALNAGELKVGYHLQSIGSKGESDAFVNSPGVPPVKPVPVPGFVLGILAAGAMGGKRLLSKKQPA